MDSRTGLPTNWFAQRRILLRLGAILGVVILSLSLFGNGSAAQDSNKPLSKDDLIGLLEGGAIPQSDIADVARSHGLSFPWSAEVESDLRAAGAEDKLINVLKQLAPKPKQTRQTPDATTTPATTTTSTSAAPVLLIEATPGGAQVYIDDEPKATTSPAGRVRFSTLAPGQHTVRLSLAGYRDYEQQVDLRAGQTATVYATLQAAQTATSTTSTSTPGQNVVKATNQQTTGSQTTTTNTNVVRFLVAHDHGLPAGQNACVGWMVVGNGKIQYQGQRAITMGQVGGPTHSLDISTDEIKEVKKNGVYMAMANAFHIRLKKGANNNFYVINAQGQYQPSEPLINAINSMMGR